MLDVAFKSEKRKGVLLLLQDGAKKMDYLLKSLDTNRQALLPQIRILEEHYLVDHYNHIYRLTDIGKLLVDEMVPLLGIIEVLDIDIDYWGNHQFDFIPPHLFKRMNELQKCEVVRPSHTDIHDLNKTVMKTSFKSEFQRAICTFYHPHFPEFFSGLMQNNADVYFITTPEVLDKLKTERIVEFEKLFESKLFHFYVSFAKLNLLAIVFNNYHLLIRPLKHDGEIDSNHILCSSPMALEWANDLFEYYLKDSTRITEI
ncbi:MAG: winged helix-turn-helix domain-containing protein [Methanolobus sp.]|uniref:helix-turn-helix transcriptional regulator n=1 Tax=Methanolobus sp. TaxID=1874737 RepID=UPI0027319297|nr:winged helix-turn-helix domain-containing protein [Methanolobus sp.]MDP2217303.1 winged helix-turn-helix domain-containing protein [Methanolobus sp.]